MAERWVHVWGFSRYMISDLGRVKSRQTGLGVQPELAGDGHYWVTLEDNQARKQIRKLCRLVLDSFEEAHVVYSPILHKDRNTANNSLENLQRVMELTAQDYFVGEAPKKIQSRKEANEDFARTIEYAEKAWKKGILPVFTKHTGGRHKAKKCRVVGTVLIYPSRMALARELGINRGVMDQVMTVRGGRYKGFVFEDVVEETDGD